MKKLIRGLVEFRKTKRPLLMKTFEKLAAVQSPKTLFVACSDSRVVPNLFASTEPGDLFVVRNVGNLFPPPDRDGHSQSDESEASALEFAVLKLGVEDVVICGHSSCGAMIASLAGRKAVEYVHLRSWLRHVDPALADLKDRGGPDKKLAEHDQLSQLNVLRQIENLSGYPAAAEALSRGALRIHGWWFDIGLAEVHAWEPAEKRFVLIDEAEAERIMERLGP